MELESQGPLVVVQLEAAEHALQKGDHFGGVEAEKHVGVLRAPVSGRIMRLNEHVMANPRLINLDPYGAGWLIEVELTNFAVEKQALITGEAALTEWYETEIKRYEEAGWLAQP